MAIKQHCDICDRVIEGNESYRTIHFGRGYNTDVDTGYDPLVVCKDCWQKMLNSVGKPELYRGIDKPQKKLTPVGNLSDVIWQGMLESCKTCKYSDAPADEDRCKSCVGE